MKPADQVVVNSVKQWFEKAVLGLNLCPFAFRPHRQGGIVFELSHADDDESCLGDLYLNLDKMDKDESIETIILILPQHLTRFTDYNQFLVLADLLLEQQGWSGVYQIASFHPDYQFEDTLPDDRSNWTNRSPFPLLHLIREQSIAEALGSSKNIERIPETNVRTLQTLDDARMFEIFGRRYRQADEDE
jgi:uncharacterized protein